MADLITTILGIVGILGLAIIVIIAIILYSAGVNIGRDQVGLRTRKLFGKKLEQGRIIACNGEIGIQADTLVPGFYIFNPFLWGIEKGGLTEVKEDQIGIVEAIDGQAIPTGRILGDAVDCNNFQDAKAFIVNGGKKGPQIGILRPGVYRINKKVFSVQFKSVKKIEEEKIGVAIALDGKPLPSGYIIAPQPEAGISFDDGQKFIDSGGYRGPQLETLQPGKYYINPLLFDIKDYDIAEVPPGYVAVIRSNVGGELVKSIKKPPEMDKKPGFDQELHEKEEVVLTVDKYQRGIWEEPIAPGKYNMNPLAFTAYYVPTSAVTIDWASSKRSESEGAVQGGIVVGRTDKKLVPKIEDITGTKASEFFKFSQLTLTSADGFILEADVRLIIRLRPQHAAFIIARFGSVTNLIEQIVHPLIDSNFRNTSGEKKAIDFIKSRTLLQSQFLEKAKEEFEKYFVEAQNLLISYIKVDVSLLKTQTDREIAVQEQEQYKQQTKAKEEYTKLREQEARAEKQKDVVDSELDINVEENKAEAARKKAMGERDSIIYKAEGDSSKIRKIGIATADAYQEQAEVIGVNKLAFIKIMEQVATGQIQITPDVLIQGTGKGGDASGNLFNAFMAMMLKQQHDNVITRKKTEIQEIEKVEEKEKSATEEEPTTEEAKKDEESKAKKEEPTTEEAKKDEESKAKKEEHTTEEAKKEEPKTKSLTDIKHKKTEKIDPKKFGFK